MSFTLSAKNYFLLLTTFMLIFSSCKKSSSSDPSPSAPSTEWFSIRQSTADTARTMNGYLYLTTSYLTGTTPGNPLGTEVITVKKIKGDFELLAKYSSFHTTGTNSTSSTFGMILSSDNPNPSNGVLSGILEIDAMYAEDSSFATNTLTKATTSREGEWYVKRTGGDYVSWFRAGSDTLFMNKTNYITSDLSFEVSIGAFDNTATNCSVHIDDFQLTGGGTDVSSDPFDKSNDVTAY